MLEIWSMKNTKMTVLSQGADSPAGKCFTTGRKRHSFSSRFNHSGNYTRIFHFDSNNPLIHSRDRILPSSTFTCKTKCLCLGSSRRKSPLSKWDLNNDRYSFWRLMSVASIKAPISVSICCLELEKHKEKTQDFQLNSSWFFFFLNLILRKLYRALRYFTCHSTFNLSQKK